jgi:hypothetical protein
VIELAIFVVAACHETTPTQAAVVEATGSSKGEQTLRIVDFASDESVIVARGKLSSLTWSPSGDALAYVEGDPYQGSTMHVMLHRPGAAEMKLVDTTSWSPSLSFSPSGSRLAVWTDAPRVVELRGEHAGAAHSVAGVAQPWGTAPTWIDDDMIAFADHGAVKELAADGLSAPRPIGSEKWLGIEWIAGVRAGFIVAMHAETDHTDEPFWLVEIASGKLKHLDRRFKESVGRVRYFAGLDRIVIDRSLEGSPDPPGFYVVEPKDGGERMNWMSELARKSSRVSFTPNGGWAAFVERVVDVAGRDTGGDVTLVKTLESEGKLVWRAPKNTYVIDFAPQPSCAP